ncbi:MAG: MFS transporter [Terracoccus sp.]
MDVRPYRYALAIRDTRNALVLGLLIRVPMFAGTVLLTLHVVIALGRSYGQAGLVAAAATVAIAISGPWRGRLLDRLGLRRTVAPSLVVQAVCWSIAPFVDYLPLTALAALAGLFAVPTFSILRQVIIRSVPEHHRRSALSLDSAATEVAFMAGPALGVWLATTWNTGWALFACEMAAVAAGCVLWVANPAIKGAPDAALRPVADAVPDGLVLESVSDGPAEPLIDGPVEPPAPSVEPVAPRAWRGFITAPVAAVYLAALCTTLVLSGSDVSIVAALRSFDATGSIGWILALWGGGSLIGGLLYGAWHRSFPVYWLLGGLSLTTAPVAFAVGVPSFAVLLVLSGPFCAPTITATVEHLSKVVPERFRGEMMGWHGSAMTGGSAVGAPVAGFAIDHAGWQWGFGVVAAAGLAVAVLGVLVTRRRRREEPPVMADSGSGAPAAILEH